MHAILTDVGNIRDRNEDLADVDAKRGLYLLADGMGGHPDGNLASRLAIEAAKKYLTAKKVAGRPRTRGAKLEQAIHAANRAILERSTATQDGRPGMGTTLVLAWLGKQYLDVAHVGDSRLYRVRDGVAECLTRDHTVVRALVERGDLEPDSPEVLQLGHILTQAVGLDPGIEPEVGRFPARQGDLYVLCSDGLSDLVPDSAIGTIVTTLASDLENAAKALIATALNAGGHDNITVIVVRDDQPRAKRRGSAKRPGAEAVSVESESATEDPTKPSPAELPS
jgi:protein phosphatase